MAIKAVQLVTAETVTDEEVPRDLVSSADEYWVIWNTKYKAVDYKTKPGAKISDAVKRWTAMNPADLTAQGIKIYWRTKDGKLKRPAKRK
jgi:hypothetical protein